MSFKVDDGYYGYGGIRTSMGQYGRRTAEGIPPVEPVRGVTDYTQGDGRSSGGSFGDVLGSEVDKRRRRVPGAPVGVRRLPSGVEDLLSKGSPFSGDDMSYGG